jgi:hypothetical protein
MGKKGKTYIKPEQQIYDIRRIFEMVTGSSGAVKPGRKELYAVLSTERIGWVNSNLGCMVSGRIQRKKASARNKLEKPFVDVLVCILRALRVCLTSERVSLFPGVLG